MTEAGKGCTEYSVLALTVTNAVFPHISQVWVTEPCLTPVRQENVVTPYTRKNTIWEKRWVILMIPTAWLSNSDWIPDFSCFHLSNLNILLWIFPVYLNWNIYDLRTPKSLRWHCTLSFIIVYSCTYTQLISAVCMYTDLFLDPTGLVFVGRKPMQRDARENISPRDRKQRCSFPLGSIWVLIIWPISHLLCPLGFSKDVATAASHPRLSVLPEAQTKVIFITCPLAMETQ